jgi:Icc-related predicted phosphoesterase
MRILSVSDVTSPDLLEDNGRKLSEKVDLIFSCGDLPPEYLTALTHFYQAPLYYVCGNHDIRYEAKTPEGCSNLHGRLIRFGELKILGLEGSFWYNGGPYQYTEGQMRTVIRRLRLAMWWQKGIDIVVTHAPPYRIQDGDDLCHRGFECFRWLINKYQPKYFIHGHIHRDFPEPSGRITVEGNTNVINTYGFHFLDIRDPLHV